MAVSTGIPISGIVVAIFFMTSVQLVRNNEFTLREDSQVFKWWKAPPVRPQMSVYIFNVTNADAFLNNGTKLRIQELGPYVYSEKWDKKNVRFNSNGTVTYNQEKIFEFQPELSKGSENDLVIVPNVPMLMTMKLVKNQPRFFKHAVASVLEIIGEEPFVELTIKQYLWGYEDFLLKVTKDLGPPLQWLGSDRYGILLKKNGISEDTLTVFTGSKDINKFGLIDKFNGRSSFDIYKTEECNSLEASDGTIFPPHVTKNATLHIFDKDLCRRLPLIFDKEVKASAGITAYRFSPPIDLFDGVEDNPENLCFCPEGPPCTPSGFFNTSICQYDSPILLSFPHFYLGNDSYRTAFEGITPPDPEKHNFYLDVNPETGTTMAAKARMQFNLAVTHVPDIKQVANIPDIVLPLIWFEESLDGLPEEITNFILQPHNDTSSTP